MPVVKAVRPRVSYTDLVQTPEDGRRYELYDGEVFTIPAPLARHQIVQHLIASVLAEYVRRTDGFAVSSPIDIVFSEYDVLQPDVAAFSAARRHLVDLDAPIRHAPDLCVEVLSPSTQATDRGKKMQMYARYGVQEHWLVDPPAGTIEVFHLRDGSYIHIVTASGGDEVTSDVLHGLTFRAGDVFPS
jgi:Uma2 family endonuclease